MMLEHATWFLFAWVFCNQAGVPVPVVPALLGVGALANGGGHLGLAAVMAIAVGAALAADLTWYGVGRWRGERGLKILGRIAPRTGLLIRRARRMFVGHEGAFQFGARFLPELNAIAGGLAGGTKARFTRFVGYSVVSALAWVGLWMGLGYVLSHALTGMAMLLGIRVIVFFVAAFAFYLPFRRARRHRLILGFGPASTMRGDLDERMKGSDRMRIQDARVRDGRGVRPLRTPVHAQAD